MCNGSPEPTLALATVDGSHWDKKLRARVSQCRKSSSSDRLMVPEHVFGLSEKPVKTFEGHSEDVLDLCWSKSQYLLSSSMDKTVKLWHMSSVSYLKTFSHCDYVTCIQFNSVDDRYFISGSLDEKVRIWSIPKPEIVDWNDLHEMVTAACYTPDGQSALVGCHKGIGSPLLCVCLCGGARDKVEEDGDRSETSKRGDKRRSGRPLGPARSNRRRTLSRLRLAPLSLLNSFLLGLGRKASQA